MRQVAGRGRSEEVEQVEDLVVDWVDAEPIRQLLIEQDCLREKVARFSYQGFAQLRVCGSTLAVFLASSNILYSKYL